jgi:hypothetical protein
MAAKTAGKLRSESGPQESSACSKVWCCPSPAARSAAGLAVVGRRDERAVVDGDDCRGLVLLSAGAPTGASRGRPASACLAHWIGMPWSWICPPQQRGGRSSGAARRGKGGGWIWQMADGMMCGARVWADRVIYACWLKLALFRVA